MLALFTLAVLVSGQLGQPVQKKKTPASLIEGIFDQHDLDDSEDLSLSEVRSVLRERRGERLFHAEMSGQEEPAQTLKVQQLEETNTFHQMDQDGDERVTRAELLSYFRMLEVRAETRRGAYAEARQRLQSMKDET